jgi:TonB family protein
MFTGLIESQRARERSAGGTAASVAAHAVVIAGVTWATLGAAPPPPVFTPPPLVVWTQVTPTPMHVWHQTTHPHACAVDCASVPPPPAIPDGPIVEITTTAGDPATLPPAISPDSGETWTGQGGAGEGGCADCVYETADELAHPFLDNAPPVYPQMLRNLRVAGTVAARFVVDTLGRVEPASVTFESGGEELFEASARRVLLSWRFVPAATNGHRVRILVRQEFSFRLTP